MAMMLKERPLASAGSTPSGPGGNLPAGVPSIRKTKKIKVGNKTDYVLRPDYIEKFQLLEN